MGEILVPNGFEATDFYANRVSKRIVEDRDTHPYVEQGMISGSKLADAPLNTILKMLGIGQEFDAYTLGKFRRGHSTEAELVELFTGLSRQEQVPNVWLEPTDKTVLRGKVMLQAEPIKGYRGMTNSVDLIEDVGEGLIIHEIKSATKSAYDYVAAVGKGKFDYQYNYTTKKRERTGTRAPEPKEHNSIQVASYALSQWEKPVLRTVLHYINADDYRMISFMIDPQLYKPEIDREIDAVQFAFETKQLPKFEPLYKWQQGKYNSFEEWEKLSEPELMAKLKGDYPEAYEKFMSTKITDNGKE